MRNDADGLDISLYAETSGDYAAKPSSAEPAGVGPHAMHYLDDDFGQSAEALMRAFNRSRRQRFLAPSAERA